ncbi:hypothetical protein SDC9_164797 [bioreactor metagenome]|uniref:Uncharacterized protein n=1 Tax=bioreactor metagenome TaxID=1076179 RepID=A0A645G004_9ZZZZ
MIHGCRRGCRVALLPFIGWHGSALVVMQHIDNLVGKFPHRLIIKALIIIVRLFVDRRQRHIEIEIILIQFRPQFPQECVEGFFILFVGKPLEINHNARVEFFGSKGILLGKFGHNLVYGLCALAFIV